MIRIRIAAFIAKPACVIAERIAFLYFLLGNQFPACWAFLLHFVSFVGLEGEHRKNERDDSKGDCNGGFD